MQLIEVAERGRLAIRVDALTREYSLNDRQVVALLHILQQGELTIQGFEQHFPTLNRRTLQRDIEGLIDKGLVISEGATNQLRYRLRPET